MLHLVKCGMSDLPPILTRAQAKAAGLTRYYTGQPCVNGHVCERNVSDTHCMDCNRDRDAARWSERRDECNARRKASWDVKHADYRAAKVPERAAREAARVAGQTTYVSAEPCKRGHVGLRTVERSRCVECLREKQRRHDAARWPARRDDCNAKRKLGKQQPYKPGSSPPYKPIFGPPMPSNSRMLKDAAIAAGKTTYFDGVPCPHGHVTERKVSNNTCCECHRLKSLAYAHRPEIHARQAEQRYARRDTPEGRAKSRAWSLQWARDNRGKVREISRARAERLAQATPAWIDWKAVSRIYNEAARLSATTGVHHHVDHVIPLKGKNVCGLHVHTNLRAVPAEINRRKSNLWLEEC